MKRFGAVASLLLVAAIGVGAFVYAGSDSGKGHKSSATVVKQESSPTVTTAKKDDPKPVTTNSVASQSPVPKPSTDDNVFHVGDDEQPELDGYEARRVFVGVSPSVVVPGKTIEIEVRGFHSKEPVNISIDPAPPKTQNSSVNVLPSQKLVITTDKRGRGKMKIPVSLAPGRWVVTALGTVQDPNKSVRSSATILKVVLKK